MITDKEGDYLITGGYNLTPVVRSITTLSPLLRLAPSQSAISTLALSADQRYDPLCPQTPCDMLEGFARIIMTITNL